MNHLNRLAASLLLATAASWAALAEDPKPAAAAPATTSVLPAAEDAAWQAVQDATKPPLPPADWNQKKPTDEEFAAFRTKMGAAAASAADKAHEFGKRFPDSPHAADAKELRTQMLQAAVQLGVKDRATELAELGGAAPAGGAPAEDPLQQEMQAAVAAAMKLKDQGMPAVFAAFEKSIREIIAKYPDRPEPYGALLEVAEGQGGDKLKEAAQEIAGSKAPAEVKQQAAALLQKYGRVGKPLDIAFTAVDGRKVSLADLKGKVVLVDFWATWCGPCVAELPKVLAAYEKLNSQGFEIVGISFDQDKDALTGFVKKKGMAWPQFFDGEGWKNKFGQEFGINSIPAMWLVDRQGNLRDMNAREELTGKVEKLLAEK